MHSRREFAERVVRLFDEHYGRPRHGNREDPLDELVYIVLSQMTTAPSCSRVFERLRHTLLSWEELVRIPVGRLADLIQDAGLFNQKAPRLKSIAMQLLVDFGSVTLDPLRSMSTDSAERYLIGLPGVGLKTAKCVLMYSLGREVLPVDTHVWRIGRRLGLIGDAVSYSVVHGALEEVVASGDRYGFHVGAVAHGRAICLDRFPRCADCFLSSLCPSGVRQAAAAIRQGW